MIEVEAVVPQVLTADIEAVVPQSGGGGSDVTTEQLNAVKADVLANTQAIEDEAERAAGVENVIINTALHIDSTGLQILEGELQLVKSNLVGTRVEVDRIPAATTTTAGIMSAEDKAKLDSLSQGGGSSGGGILDAEINENSQNAVQNQAIAKALEAAVAKGRELAKRDLYISAGAEYNDTDEIVKRTAFWGEVVNHLPKHYYLNGLGDIGEEEMMMIYRHKDDMTMFLSAKNQSRFFQDNAFVGYRTLFGFNGGTRFIDGLTISAANPFTNTNDLEIIKWLPTDKWSVFSTNITIVAKELFFNISKVRVIDAYTPSASEFFYYAYALEHIRLYKLSYNVNLSYSKNISKESVLHMIQNATPTSAIIITLHADAYARLADDADIVAALANQPLVTLVSA